MAQFDLYNEKTKVNPKYKIVVKNADSKMPTASVLPIMYTLPVKLFGTLPPQLQSKILSLVSASPLPMVILVLDEGDWYRIVCTKEQNSETVEMKVEPFTYHFSSRGMLISLSNSASWPNKCPICGAEIQENNGRAAWTHMRRHGEKRLCLQCNKELSTASHLCFKVRENFEVSCKVCNRIFASEQSLSNHMNTHTGHKPYHCRFCDKSFAAPSTRTVHHLRIHQHTQAQVTKANRKNSPSKLKPSSSYCQLCNIQFRYTYQFSQHNKNIHSGVVHHCNTCAKVLKTKGNLLKHQRSAHSLEKFTCDLCSKAFSQKANLTRHINTVHQKKECLLNRGFYVHLGAPYNNPPIAEVKLVSDSDVVAGSTTSTGPAVCGERARDLKVEPGIMDFDPDHHGIKMELKEYALDDLNSPTANFDSLQSFIEADL